MLRCAYCGALLNGAAYPVHRDGYGLGPIVDLCPGCYWPAHPTMIDIWARIAKPSADPKAFYPLRIFTGVV